MSAGSGASNLGYGNINPYNTSSYVNGTSSNYSGSFSSNEIPGTPPGPLPGLAGAKYNVDAAAGKVPGICMKGGAKKIKRKIKNITKQYKKMKGGQSKSRIMKQLSKSRMLSKSLAIAGGRRRSRRMSKRLSRRNRSVSRRRRQQRGGSYMSNVPNTPTYSTGGVLSAGSSALANPVPYTVTGGNVNCVDNYNHFTGKGIQTV